MPGTRSLLLAFATLACLARAEPGVYVWRLQKDPELAGEIKRSGLSRVLVLAAEIPADDTPPRRSGNLAAVMTAGVGDVVPVVRAARPVRDFATNPEWRRLLADEALRAAGKAGVIQIDFDCPQRRLPDYAKLLGELRSANPRLRISVTGMPCWLGEPGLRELLAQTESWTLQIHLTEMPADGLRGKEPPLCDTAKARGWIAAAAKTGKPFHVAVPTYAYVAHYGRDGRFMGLESESVRDFPAGERPVYWAPDFAALAKLVSETREGTPTGFSGFDWYRLPQGGDRLNLTEAAFTGLTRGEAPQPAKIVLRATPAGNGRIADLAMVNEGGLAAAIPETVSIRTVMKPEAYDLPGSECIRETDTELTVSPATGILRAGERLALGWVRFSSASESPSLSFR